MAPHNARGSLNIMFQLAVTIGILAAQLINYGTQYLRPYGWRVSLAMGAVPALLLTFGAIILPDTPNSLVLRGHKEEGRRVLQRVRGTSHVDVEFEVGARRAITF
jgi:MFS family permease